MDREIIVSIHFLINIGGIPSELELLFEADDCFGVLFDPLIALAHHRIGKAFSNIVHILLCGISQSAEDLQGLGVSLILIVYMSYDISGLFEKVQLSTL